MTQPGSETWLSDVQASAVISQPDAHAWDHITDVLVVGLGGAGVCAALQAREAGCDVTVVERFGGGGATAISGGVVYAGATEQQKAAGVEDSVDAMTRYLELETGDVVSSQTLRRFCERSAENLAWLGHHGVPFEGSLCPVKTSYPTDEYYLYYSGNESIDTYARVAKPAPRGHRAKGRALPGASLFEPLRASAAALGVLAMPQTRVTRLLTDPSERVIGVEARQLPAGLWRRLHHLAWRAGLRVRNYLPALSKRLAQHCTRIEQAHGRRIQIRARRGVVLAAGGFIHNRPMVSHYAPRYRPGMPLGTAGCDGSGIRLGQSVGGAVRHMERVSAWRFINPPQAWARGIFVNGQGERYCNEAVYGAKLGRLMVEEHDGVGILIIDAALRAEAFRQLGPGRAQWFQSAPGILNMIANSRSAPTIEALAREIGVAEAPLRTTLATYNDAIRLGQPDSFGKSDSFRQAMPSGPYFAMNCGIRSKRFPCPTLTLGGLVVDEATGAVRREGGASIPGLYAAGRTAVGVSSNAYVSGLSLADCVFSGRRAGRAAAGADPTP